MPALLDQLAAFSTVQAWVFFALVNLGIFVASISFCGWLGHRFRHRRLFDRWEPFDRAEGLAALFGVFLNVAVSVFGWRLWTLGWIELRPGTWWNVGLDTCVMVLAMDLGMYWLHRLGHLPLFYRWFHAFHHRHEVTNPISLFVLHPLEVLGFGGLMLTFLWVYPMDPVALVAYLTLNVLFGTLGHSGVEPFSHRLPRIPLLRLVGTSTFHAGHHEAPRHNFGFYTLLWDHLFGTLDPGYWRRYREAVR